MPTYAGSRMPPPESWSEFEDIVCSAAKNRWDNPNSTKHGHQGQKQDGVDVYGNDHNDELQRALPFDPTVRLIRDHDFNGPFLRTPIQPLFDFVDT